jgi:hypothetical protein
MNLQLDDDVKLLEMSRRLKLNFSSCSENIVIRRKKISIIF